MHVEIKQQEARRLGAVQHIGPYNEIASAFEKLGAIAGPAGLFAHPGVAMIALYRDDPESTPKDQLRSAAAITVPEDAELPPGLVEQHIPAGRYARTVHHGPYDTLGDTWARFMGEWLPNSGQRMTDGVAYELYANNPQTTAPEDLRTEIYIPLE
jgi:AraC family transcriptional regulator